MTSHDTPASPLRSHPVVRRILPVLSAQISAKGQTLEVVGLDDHVPFGCNRTANCCTGRGEQHANLVTPTEVAHIFRAMRAGGDVATIHDLVPAVIARVAGVTSKSAAAKRLPPTRRSDKMLPNPDVDINDDGVHFMGLYFRMLPDPSMPDGDRCVFLQGDAATGFGCRWHGQRAQPTPCALAPLALPPTRELADVGAFFYDRGRARWCDGMRRAMAGDLPGTTVRALLDRNDGWDRCAEQLAVQEARTATTAWTRGFRNHHSPLAKLYIDQTPELAPLLVGF